MRPLTTSPVVFPGVAFTEMISSGSVLIRAERNLEDSSITKTEAIPPKATETKFHAHFVFLRPDSQRTTKFMVFTAQDAHFHVFTFSRTTARENSRNSRNSRFHVFHGARNSRNSRFHVFHGARNSRNSRFHVFHGARNSRFHVFTF